MTRNDVPFGKGQCDIRLRVDGEVEVSVRGDMVYVRTISGRDARDEGSECNDPLPARNIQDFGFEVQKGGGISGCSPRPTAAGTAPQSLESVTGKAERALPFPSELGHGRRVSRRTRYCPRVSGERGDLRPPFPDRGRPDWNESVEFRGRGSGIYARSNERRRLLDNAEVSVDRDGRVRVRFDTNDGPPLAFVGRLSQMDRGVLTADVVAGDQTMGLRGPMIITLDGRRQVASISMQGTAGRRDSFNLRWRRR